MRKIGSIRIYKHILSSPWSFSDIKCATQTFTLLLAHRIFLIKLIRVGVIEAFCEVSAMFLPYVICFLKWILVDRLNILFDVSSLFLSTDHIMQDI